MHVDELAIRAEMPMSQLLVILFNLEMKKVVDQLPGNFYALRRM